MGRKLTPKCLSNFNVHMNCQIQIVIQQVSGRAWGPSFLISTGQGRGHWSVEHFVSRKDIHSEGLCQLKVWLINHCCATLNTKIILQFHSDHVLILDSLQLSKIVISYLVK